MCKFTNIAAIFILVFVGSNSAAFEETIIWEPNGKHGSFSNPTGNFSTVLSHVSATADILVSGGGNALVTAVSAAPSGTSVDPYVIEVAAGTYDGGIILADKTNIVIRNANGADPVIDCTSLTLGTSALRLDATSDLSVSNIAIVGLTFRNIRYNSGGSAVTGHGIASFSGKIIENVLIEDCFFDNSDPLMTSDFKGIAIHLNQVDGLLIRRNKIVNSGLHASNSPQEDGAITIHEFIAGTAPNYLNNVFIQNNHILFDYMGSLVGASTRGIVLGHTGTSTTFFNNVVVEYNLIDNVQKEGIKIFGTSSDSGDDETVSVSNCVIRQTSDGVELDGGALVIERTIFDGQNSVGSEGKNEALDIDGGTLSTANCIVFNKLAGITGTAMLVTCIDLYNTITPHPTSSVGGLIFNDDPAFASSSTNDYEITNLFMPSGCNGGEFGLLLITPPPPPTVVWVDDDYCNFCINDGHTWGTDAFSSIQDGINAIADGGQINILEGVFEEQLEIDRAMSLVGAGVGLSVIKSPVTLTKFFTTSADNYPIVYVHNTGNANISEVTIDGFGRGNTNFRFVGVGYHNAGGILSNSEVLDIRNTPIDGSQHGIGIFASATDGTPRNLIVSGCLFEGFQKNGMALTGTDLTAEAGNNTVIGAGAVDFIAQNGIQLSSGATGTVLGNIVSGFSYTPFTFAATGVLIFDAVGNIQVNGNEVNNSLVGIWYINSQGSINLNSVNYTLAGMGSTPYWWGIVADPGIGNRPQPEPHLFDTPESISSQSKTNNVTHASSSSLLTTNVFRNEVDGGGNGTGIEADVFGTETLIFSATENTIINCEAAFALFRDPTAFLTTTIRNNSADNSNNFGFDNQSDQFHDITENYWGAQSGPNHAATNTTAFGPEISSTGAGSLEYAPWFVSIDASPLTKGYQAASPIAWGMNQEVTLIDLITNDISVDDSIYMRPGSYAEGPQVLIDKNVTIIGESRATTILTPTANTGSSGGSRGWFLVNSGITFNLSTITLDGSGFKIWQAIRTTGGGVIDQVNFHNIGFDPSTSYQGIGIAAFGNDNVTISNSEFQNMGRIGALLFGAGLTNSFFTGNTYVGKGAGNWLDYCADISAGAIVNASNNSISNCLGVASSDGSISAGLIVSTFFGAGTSAILDGNTITNCTDAINIGFDASDASTVIATNNDLIDNSKGLSTAASSAISLTAYGNFFSNIIDAEDNVGGTWDDGISIGNCWSDFATNSGFPSHYVVAGSAGAQDNFPNTNCAIGFSITNLNYLCDGPFSFDVLINDLIIDMEAANIGISYPAELVNVSVTPGNSNIQTFPTIHDNSSGLDTLFVSLAVLSGSQNGPATLFTVTLNGSASVCTGGFISMFLADLRDGGNNVISSITGSPIDFVSDCADPTFVVNSPACNLYFNVPPVLDISAADNCLISQVSFQVDACNPGGWTEIVNNPGSGTYNNPTWILPGFAALADGDHCIYFRVIDEHGRGNADSCTTQFCLIKDVTPPDPPQNIVAIPGHNRVSLSWTNPSASDLVNVKIQRVAWGDYPDYAVLAPAFPSDDTRGLTIFDGIATTHIDINALSNSTRDIYFYAAFALDSAGNISAPDPQAQAKATSYYLGDIADAITSVGAFDGLVFFGDLAVFSITFGKADGDAGFINHADFGPTDPGGSKDTPVPDDSVNFEDLVIYAINFDAVSPAAKIIPLLPNNVDGGKLGISLKTAELNGKPGYELSLINNSGDVKAIHATISIQSNAIISNVQVNEQLLGNSQNLFQSTSIHNGRLEFDLAILGKETTIGGSGNLLTFLVSLQSDENATVKLVDAQLRDIDNQDLGAEIQNLAPVILPVEFALDQNYPNPFNPATVISYRLPNESNVKLEIFNLLGQRVNILVDEFQAAGKYETVWDGKERNGMSAASGIYFYRLVTKDNIMTRKMMLLK